jgi:hypothetical protein
MNNDNRFETAVGCVIAPFLVVLGMLFVVGGYSAVLGVIFGVLRAMFGGH